jgi:hypothetical protein
MSTIINFTDPTKPSITVNDGVKLDPGVSGNPTPLTFLGKKYPNTYSKDIAENFLHILENFASSDPPAAPVEGQLWLNTNALQEVDTGNDSQTTNESFGLKMRIGNSWLPIGIVKKSAISPSSGNIASINLKKGDLYVDTSKNQLYIYNGTGGYSLVGPFFNALEKTGLEVEEIINSADNQPIPVITFFIKARRVAIYSDRTFVPKLIYEGFKEIKQGFNLSKSTFDTDTKFWGTSEKALSLIVGDAPIGAANFLRSDVISTTNHEFNIRSTSGINLGTDSSFNISSDSSGAYLYNKNSDSDIDIRIKKSNSTEYNTVLRVSGEGGGKVGINKTNPQQALDINGNLALSGDILTPTGRLVCKDLEVDTDTGSASLPGLIIDSDSINFSRDLIPLDPTNPNNKYDLGSSDNIWENLYVKQIGKANQYPLIYGNIIANQLVVGGIARTVLTSSLDISDDEVLVDSTDSFPLTGTIIIDNEEIQYTSKISSKFLGILRGVNNTTPSDHISGRYVLLKSDNAFGNIDGYARGLSSDITLTTSSDSDIDFTTNTGSNAISFKDAGESITITTSLNSNLIVNKPQLTYVQNNDLFLIQSGNSFYKASKQDLANSLPLIPTGTILLHSGSLSDIPVGFLPCDGRELLQTFYAALHQVVGEKYKKYAYLSTAGTGVQQFALPDLRNQVPNFKPKELQYGLEYVITELGNTDWSSLGYSGTPLENGVFTATWGAAPTPGDLSWRPPVNPGTGTGRARLLDGLHYIIYTGKI